MKKRVLVIILLTAVLSCSNQDNKRQLEVNNSSDRNGVIGESKKVHSSNSFGIIDALNYSDSRIIVRDAKGPPFIHVYNLNEEKVESFGERGNGPNKFTKIWETGVVNQGRNYRFYDAPTRRVVKCNGKEIKDSEYACKEELKLTGEGIPLRVNLNHDSKIFATGLYNKRVAVYEAGKKVKVFGELPGKVNIEEEINRFQISRAYQAYITVNKKEKRIALLSRYSKRLDIFGIKKDSIVFVSKYKGDSYVRPSFSLSPTRNLAPNGETTIAYRDACSNDEYIYGLFYGSRINDENDIENSEIRIFSWGGDLVKRINVDKKLTSIDVNEDGDLIYGTIDYPSPSIVKVAIK